MNSTLHSVVDLITNSSTEIFTFANDNAIKSTLEMLNKVLLVAGVPKKAEDLFTVTAMIRYTYWDEDGKDHSMAVEAKTDQELKKINMKINSYVYANRLVSLEAKIVLKGKFGEECDLADLVSSILHSEECSTS